jgi:DNA-binding response OmpR family regulator
MSVPVAGGDGVRVLVVEDEAAIRRVVVGYLHQDGFEVFEAANGLRAIGTAREVRPDVVVLDLMLPDVDGVDAGRCEPSPTPTS